MQPGFFDQEDRLAKLEKLDDPLPRLDSVIDWYAFRPLLKVIHQKQRKSNAGRKAHKEHKLIRRYAVTDASVHDSQVFDQVLDNENSGRSIWADSAYRPEAREEQLRERGYKSRIHRKGGSRRSLNQQEQASNHRRSKVRARVEHVFGDQRTRQGNILVRTKAQGPGSGEDWIDESDVKHATAGVPAQTPSRLLHGLIGRKPVEGGGERRTRRESWVAESKDEQSAQRYGTAATLITPRAASERIDRGAQQLLAGISVGNSRCGSRYISMPR
ncbi:MAG TPA: transposase [Denitromonas sp.]|nr:transposase [Denitromonas sp.]